MAEELCPEISWPKVRGLGNVLRHEYDRIDVVRLWLLIEDDLPPRSKSFRKAKNTVEKSALSRVSTEVRPVQPAAACNFG